MFISIMLLMTGLLTFLLFKISLKYNFSMSTINKIGSSTVIFTSVVLFLSSCAFYFTNSSLMLALVFLSWSVLTSSILTIIMIVAGKIKKTT